MKRSPFGDNWAFTSEVDEQQLRPLPSKDPSKKGRAGPCWNCRSGNHHMCTSVGCYRCPRENHTQPKTQHVDRSDR